jgi:hypothetical protein
MTYLHSFNSRATWRKPLWALVFFLGGCSSIHDLLYSEPAKEEIQSPQVEERRQERVVSSQFEWAVQNYEAGAYDKAISQFKRLQSQGSQVPSYELIPFYLGMSYFQKKQDSSAIPQLESFLKQGGSVGEQQQARISLLLAYERQSQWNKVAALAAESNKQNFFQENRTLLYLVWARALREKGELQGARSALKEGEQLLLNSAGAEILPMSDPNNDLHGRLHFTSAYIQLSECMNAEPKEIAKGKKSRQRLYAPWLESVGQCLQNAQKDSVELVRRESTWMLPALQSVDASLVSFTNKVRGYLTQEQSRMEQKRALEKGTRQELYRLLAPLDDSIKNFKNQGIMHDPLMLLRKRIDALLVSLSLPSSER